MAYEVRVAPGCHGGPDPSGPVVSRHHSLPAAVKAARRSDRLVVERVDRWGVIYQAPKRDHPRLGAGRYGLGARRSEEPLDEAIAGARAAEEGLAS